MLSLSYRSHFQVLTASHGQPCHEMGCAVSQNASHGTCGHVDVWNKLVRQ